MFKQSFSILAPPCGKPSMVKSDAWAKRPAVERYWKWCDAAREACTGIADKDLGKLDALKEGIIGFWAFAYIRMPETWSAKKKAMYSGKLCAAKPDCSNIQKSLEDALFIEDKFLHSPAVANKFWCPVDEEPRLDVFLLILPEAIPKEEDAVDDVSEEE